MAHELTKCREVTGCCIGRLLQEQVGREREILVFSLPPICSDRSDRSSYRAGGHYSPPRARALDRGPRPHFNRIRRQKVAASSATCRAFLVGL